MKMTKQNPQRRLVIGNLTLRNLPDYRRSILSGERIFHPDIRLSSEDLTTILASQGSVGKVALLNQRYIGNVIGFSPSSEQIEEMELHGVKEDPRGIYVYNFVIAPRFQGRGYGTRLLDRFIQECRSRGYVFLEAHFRNGSSLHIAEKKGARKSRVYPDWQGTGEEYTHCKLRL
jgi:ribosomal protein S18 acetylase RimI-like enzyme